MKLRDPLSHPYPLLNLYRDQLIESIGKDDSTVSTRKDLKMKC